MKKIWSLVLALALSMSLMAGCSSGDSQETRNVTQDSPVPGQESRQPSEEKGTSGGTREETLEEQVLLDEKGVKITAKSIDKSGWLGPELKLLIENGSEQNLTVQARAASVNGYMVETMMSADVAAGKKANDALVFASGDLEACGIETIANMEFSFHIFTTDGWETYLDSEQLRVETSAHADFEYIYDDSGVTLYEGNGVKIISKGLRTEGVIFGPELILYIENTGEKAITVQTRDVSVNGYMVNALMSEDVLPGKRAIGDMTFMKSTLEENGIEAITELEFSFHIFDDDWETIVDTEMISLTVE